MHPAVPKSGISMWKTIWPTLTAAMPSPSVSIPCAVPCAKRRVNRSPMPTAASRPVCGMSGRSSRMPRDAVHGRIPSSCGNSSRPSFSGILPDFRPFKRAVSPVCIPAGIRNCPFLFPVSDNVRCLCFSSGRFMFCLKHTVGLPAGSLLRTRISAHGMHQEPRREYPRVQ